MNCWWERLPAAIIRVIVVKNRSHNPKTTDSKLQSFFSDQTGRLFGRRRRSYETSLRYVRELASLAPWPTQWWECWRQSVTNLGRYKITGQPVLITAVSHRRMLYFENLVGQVAPLALPDLRKYPIWNYIQFLLRSDWPFFLARGRARVKLHSK